MIKRTTTESKTHQEDLARPVRAVTAAFTFILLLLVGLVSLVAVMAWLGDFKRPEIILTLVLIAGVIALMCSLAAMFALLRTFGQSSGSDALGLPPGSVRAMLALMLVLVFAILSVFLYYNAAQGGIRSTGLTQQQIGLLPEERIIAIQAETPAPGSTPGGEQLFTVESQQGSASEDLAQQLITLIGTLVTAVAAFYFGSNSVVTAIKARDANRTNAPMPVSSSDSLQGASTSVTTTTETIPADDDASGGTEPTTTSDASTLKPPAADAGPAVDVSEG